ncbi:MAG: response regulator [Proteobacteria bacterium]|nr:response regulator [Pseudomonadota bacterium]
MEPRWLRVPSRYDPISKITLFRKRRLELRYPGGKCNRLNQISKTVHLLHHTAIAPSKWAISMTQAPRKILIIDDDVTALDIVDFLFEEKGFEVIRRADGPSAISCVDEVLPDVVLVDLMMPKMNGQETVRQLRKKGLVVPIVAFTALDDPDVHQEALDAGCNLVLTKPCKPAVLVQHIQNLLKQ